MTDIVERLRELERVERELAHDSDCPPEATANWQYAETCKSAAAEIERLTGERDRQYDYNAEIIAKYAALEAESERLRAALRPLAGMFLYPDDLGYEASSDIKEDLDWDDDANDMITENVFVLRRDIRRARTVLEEK